MRQKVLVIEDSKTSLTLLNHLIKKAGLVPVCATSLVQAQHMFQASKPEQYLCAVVDFNLPDAANGEAIDFAISSYLPTVVITGSLDEHTRNRVLEKPVVDYIPKENAQVYDYLSRLLARLEKNKHIGVLVVDDSRIGRNQVVGLLRRHNFITFEAASAELGLEMLAQHDNIKLVITDEHMAGMSGVELVAQVRKQYSKDQLGIIGVSSDGSSALSARFIKSGANDYLKKPYCHEEFFCRILQNVEHIENIETIRRAANADYLTGLPNRRYFFSCVENIVTPDQDHSLALIDLDHFKNINDNYGHDAGDAMLKAVARLMAKCFANQLVARFGGEEFCVFLAGFSLGPAMDMLETFRHQVEQLRIKSGGHTLSCTISVGLTCRQSTKIAAMISEADELLYRAKQAGRNQLAFA